jgi:hypothetical protein
MRQVVGDVRGVRYSITIEDDMEEKFPKYGKDELEQLVKSYMAHLIAMIHTPDVRLRNELMMVDLEGAMIKKEMIHQYIHRFGPKGFGFFGL